MNTRPVRSSRGELLSTNASPPWLESMLHRLRTSFAEESVDPRALWYLASEGLAAWVRYVERALGDHLDDRQRARAILTEACGQMFLRRVRVLAPRWGLALDGAEPVEVRALFEALYPGPVGRSIRWSLDGLIKQPPALDARLRAWRRVMEMDARTRWLEVSHHLGELAIVLTERLPAHRVPRAIGWLGDVCHAFGREVGELGASVFNMPASTESAIETLRMGELLFRVNPEHLSGSDDEQGTGFIEGNACLWYERPGWGAVHCGVLGRFQAGISEVFGRRYSLTRTIPKNGGSSCRISLTPIPEREPAARPAALREEEAPAWQPPSRLLGNLERAAMMAAFAQDRDPAHGFFGPDTLLWIGTREMALLLGGGRAALMQLAHPAVAHAIRDHSTVHEDRIGRFIRTMLAAYGVLFGSVDEALEITDRVYRIHSRISGLLDDVPGQDVGYYHALDGEATFWVGATLFDTSMLMYEQVIHPFTPEQRDRLVREAGAFWGLFGVPLEACPTSWTELHGYVERRSESLAPQVGETARREVELLFTTRVELLQPAFEQLRLVTAHLLPPPLQRAFGMELGIQERMLARGWLFAAERMIPRLPPLLRFVPHYNGALWRVRGAAQQQRLERTRRSANRA